MSATYNNSSNNKCRHYSSVMKSPFFTSTRNLNNNLLSAMGNLNDKRIEHTCTSTRTLLITEKSDTDEECDIVETVRAPLMVIRNLSPEYLQSMAVDCMERIGYFHNEKIYRNYLGIALAKAGFKVKYDPKATLLCRGQDAATLTTYNNTLLLTTRDGQKCVVQVNAHWNRNQSDFFGRLVKSDMQALHTFSKAIEADIGYLVFMKYSTVDGDPCKMSPMVLKLISPNFCVQST